MDIAKFFKGLVDLGKIGGVPAVALGVIALAILTLIIAPDTVPDDWRGPVLVMAAVLAVLVLVITRPGAQVAGTKGDGAEARNEDRSKTPHGRQSARTKGDKSPAINKRG